VVTVVAVAPELGEETLARLVIAPQALVFPAVQPDRVAELVAGLAVVLRVGSVRSDTVISLPPRTGGCLLVPRGGRQVVAAVSVAGLGFGHELDLDAFVERLAPGFDGSHRAAVVTSTSSSNANVSCLWPMALAAGSKRVTSTHRSPTSPSAPPTLLTQ
jgi:hypothetical protein